MSDDNSLNQPPSPSASSSRPRRASIAELFRPDQSSASATRPSSLSTAMAQAQQQSRTRRLSITALGLSGSPTRGQPPSPFGSLRDRGKSISDSSTTGYDDNENAIAEDGEPASAGTNGLGSMRRRMSAGAKAYSEGMRRSSGNNGANMAPLSAASSTIRPGGSPPTASKPKLGEGFTWGDSLRMRAERQSISAASGAAGASFGLGHVRSPSQVEQAPANPTPPAPKPVQTKPDHFQERILKGDFYMD